MRIFILCYWCKFDCRIICLFTHNSQGFAFVFSSASDSTQHSPQTSYSWILFNKLRYQIPVIRSIKYSVSISIYLMIPLEYLIWFPSCEWKHSVVENVVGQSHVLLHCRIFAVLGCEKNVETVFSRSFETTWSWVVLVDNFKVLSTDTQLSSHSTFSLSSLALHFPSTQW